MRHRLSSRGRDGLLTRATHEPPHACKPRDCNSLKRRSCSLQTSDWDDHVPSESAESMTTTAAGRVSYSLDQLISARFRTRVASTGPANNGLATPGYTRTLGRFALPPFDRRGLIPPIANGGLILGISPSLHTAHPARSPHQPPDLHQRTSRQLTRRSPRPSTPTLRGCAAPTPAFAEGCRARRGCPVSSI